MCTSRPKKPKPPPKIQAAVAPDEDIKKKKLKKDDTVGDSAGSLLTGSSGVETSSLNIGSSSLLGGGSK